MKFICVISFLFTALFSIGQASKVIIDINDMGDNLPIVYAGYSNRIKLIPVAGDTNTYLLKSPGNYVKKGLDDWNASVKNEYRVLPYRKNRIKLVIENSNDPSDKKVVYYEITTLKDPQVYFGKVKSGDRALRRSKKLSIRHDGGRFVIESFTINIVGYEPMETKGNKLNRRMRSILKRMNSGDILFVMKVRGPDGIVRNISGAFRID